jgi:hypothetical protein
MTADHLQANKKLETAKILLHSLGESRAVGSSGFGTGVGSNHSSQRSSMVQQVPSAAQLTAFSLESPQATHRQQQQQQQQQQQEAARANPAAGLNAVAEEEEQVGGRRVAVYPACLMLGAAGV